MMTNLLLMFVAGALLTYGSIERTLQAGAGRWAVAGFSASLVSLATWFSVLSASQGDVLAYSFFALGTVLSTMWTAHLHQTSEQKTSLKSGTVMYRLPGDRSSKIAAAPCLACNGTGRRLLINQCKVCDGAGAFMFQYRVR